MKRYLNITVLLLAGALALLQGCKKLPDGFISPIIRYEEDPILIQKGRVKISSALNFDGSSRPATVTLLHIYDKATGKNVDELFSKQMQLSIWTGYYIPSIDTTLAMVNAKKKDTLVPPIVINQYSGQLEANVGTADLPSGDYTFDLEIKNGAGTRTYPKIGNFTLIDAPAYESPDAPYIRMSKVGDESTGAANLTGASELEIKVDYAGATTPNKIILKVVDKNDIPFNPTSGEVARRPNTGLNPVPPFLQTLQDYSFKTTLFNDRMEFDYVTTPFPLASLGNGYNIYYRIPAQYLKYSDQVKYPAGQWNANPRFSFRAYRPGTFTITFKMLKFTRS
ncbi:MAG TPA: DUF5007 domain-containing protein [Niabella sp.]|nr:DUF5007 domain-containing protein [Niabella sp.]